MTADEENVSVLVRIRPLNAMEIEACGRVVAHKTPGEPQLSLGEKKQFTYDSVLPICYLRRRHPADAGRVRAPACGVARVPRRGQSVV